MRAALIAAFPTPWVGEQSGDAARKPDEVKAMFAEGIENSLAAFAHDPVPGERDQRAGREVMLATIASAVGALVLSRACPDDSPLADEILDVCRKRILASLPPEQDQ